MTYNPGRPYLAPVLMPIQSPVSIGADIISAAQTYASATWPSANRALYFPYYIPGPVTVVKLYWTNGAAVSGNVDAGIYNEAGTRLVSIGSTAQAGVSVIQEVDITDTLLTPGTYYLALAMDNTTGTMLRISANVALHRAMGCAQQATAFALPATFTLAAATSSFIPMAGMSLRTLVA